MAEYIKREDALEVLKRNPIGTWRFVPVYSEEIKAAMNEINDLPAADVVEMRHGRWEWFDEENGNQMDGYEREWGWRCSGCRMILPDDYDDPDTTPKMNYCPNCGTRMDKEDEHEAD